MRHVLGGAIAIGASLMLIACGGGASESQSQAERQAAEVRPTTAGATQTAGATDPCSLLTRAEVGEALGATVGTQEVPPQAAFACRYTAPRGQGLAVLTVLLINTPTPAAARAGFQSAKSQFPQAQVVSGIGDEAFYIGDQLHILKGSRYLTVSGDVDLTKARALADKALARLN